jgi:acetolactate synthase-1/2/3 large subunit
MKASDYIAHFIRSKGITSVFELSGGMITHILDSLHQIGGIEIVTMHHEQGASFAADGYARAKGLPGLALATSGPGATNLLTGIGSCYFDSVPGIFITGQVNIHEQKGSRAIRQLGFQETDIVSMAIPITKKCYRITSASQLPEVLEEAFQISMSGRPGPVLIDIPMNVQREQIDREDVLPSENKVRPVLPLPENTLSELIDAITKSEKPLVLAGRGIRAAEKIDLFHKFIETVQVPVVTSLLGLDSISYEHPLRVGFLGAYGNRWVNMAIGESDLIIVLGSRLDIRQTGSDVGFFERNRTIFHVDCEEGELNNRLKSTIVVHADLNDFLPAVLARCASREFQPKSAWLKRIAELKEGNSDLKELRDLDGKINPNRFMHALSKRSKGISSAYTADVGNHQMWSAQSLELTNDQLFVTSGGMGAMGHALPAAIGIYFAHKKPNVVIAGDGGFQLNIQELQTIVRNQIPIKMVVINNKNLGMIRQFQDSYFDSRYQSTFWGYSPPDFEKVAVAYGIDAATIADESETDAALEKMWQHPDRPFLLQVMVGSYLNAYPKIAFGKPLTEMEPDFKPLEMEGT